MKIELTTNEATVLHIILERIAGDEYLSGRKHSTSILRKLEAAGDVYSIEKEAFFPVSEARNVITFV